MRKKILEGSTKERDVFSVLSVFRNQISPDTWKHIEESGAIFEDTIKANEDIYTIEGFNDTEDPEIQEDIYTILNTANKFNCEFIMLVPQDKPLN